MVNGEQIHCFGYRHSVQTRQSRLKNDATYVLPTDELRGEGTVFLQATTYDISGSSEFILLGLDIYSLTSAVQIVNSILELEIALYHI